MNEHSLQGWTDLGVGVGQIVVSWLKNLQLVGQKILKNDNLLEKHLIFLI